MQLEMAILPLQEPPDGTRSQGCSLLPLDRPVAFEHEVDFEPQPPLKPTSRHGSGVQYNAKVAARHLFSAQNCRT